MQWPWMVSSLRCVVFISVYLIYIFYVQTKFIVKYIFLISYYFSN